MQSLTGLDARKELKTFKDRKKLPLIFLDEFHASKSKKDVELFGRSLIRSMGLIPVVMGTNSKASNFIEFNPESGKGESYTIWCYLFTKLPKFPPQLIEKIIDDTLKKCNIDIDKSNEMEKFVDALIRLLQKERPFFVVKMLEYFEDNLHRLIFETSEKDSASNESTSLQIDVISFLNYSPRL